MTGAGAGAISVAAVDDDDGDDDGDDVDGAPPQLLTRAACAASPFAGSPPCPSAPRLQRARPLPPALGRGHDRHRSALVTGSDVERSCPADCGHATPAPPPPPTWAGGDDAGARLLPPFLHRRPPRTPLPLGVSDAVRSPSSVSSPPHCELTMGRASRLAPSSVSTICRSRNGPRHRQLAHRQLARCGWIVSVVRDHAR